MPNQGDPTATTPAASIDPADKPLASPEVTVEERAPAVSLGDPILPARSCFLQLGEEIARGGMGAVFRAHDPVLGRDLAVKILLQHHRGTPALLHRFAEEARVAGRLQHPGVPPVYEVGLLPDGRPFIAMKLIEGSTLARLLADRQGPSADLPRFLAVFEQVCQTVGYAHSKGIIHRDLKPLNVMVGAFGEVQVMDWGLAKRVDRGSSIVDRVRPQGLPDPSAMSQELRSTNHE